MSLTIRRTIIPLLSGILVLGLLLWLGLWQLDRADQKQAFADAFAAAQHAPAVTVLEAASLASSARFTRVAITGRYEARRQGLLDVQMHEGRAGYRVWTPFHLASGGVVLVDRGWVPAAGDRSILPDIDIPEGDRKVTGLVSPLPEPGLRLGPAEQGEPTWPRRLHWPDADALARLWGENVTPVLILLDPVEPNGFVRDWDPVGLITPERHLGYAVQWFALALALFVIAVVLIVRNKERQDA